MAGRPLRRARMNGDYSSLSDEALIDIFLQIKSGDFDRAGEELKKRGYTPKDLHEIHKMYLDAPRNAWEQSESIYYSTRRNPISSPARLSFKEKDRKRRKREADNMQELYEAYRAGDLDHRHPEPETDEEMREYVRMLEEQHLSSGLPGRYLDFQRGRRS